MIRSAVRCVVWFCLTGMGALASAAGPAVTDPAKAGPDFTAQGEYVGEFERDGQKSKLGVQVIALGKGQFEAVVYAGGLPGDGWTRDDEKRSFKGQMKDGTVVFEGEDGGRGELKDGEEVFKERTSLVFKTMQVVRFFDRKRNTLVYLVYSDRVIEGSPQNSVTAIPILPWPNRP